MNYNVGNKTKNEKRIIMRYIDFRSDTVTLPTEEMKEAMIKAPLGDDVYGDDPTVNELEELAAQMMGKEAALFVPSGTFGNQLCVLTHTLRGDEVILEANCHIKKYEVGASSVIAGVQLSSIEGHLGKMDIEKIEQAIRNEDIHYPRTGLICLENATGVGTVLDLAYMRQVREISLRHQIPIHLDGARIFNAAWSLGCEVKEIAQYVDSVMFCLSKGLCAPIGSMVVGTREFINRARKNRKLMGGGLRQAGILAACGIVALKEMTKRLYIDHENAKYLADRLEELPGFKVYRDRLQINMVFATINGKTNFPGNFPELLLKKGIKVGGYRGKEIRFVTHHDITRNDIDYLIYCLKEILN